MNTRKDSSGADFTLERKTVTLDKALKVVVDQTVHNTMFKWFNPIYKLYRKITGKKNATEF